MQIRRATVTDAPFLAEFNRAMAHETEQKHLPPEVVLAGVRSLLAAPDAGFYLVAQQDARLIGCLMVTFEWSDWRDGQFWWIQSVYVHPDFRRQGIFRALYREVERLARASGDVCGLRLYVAQDNSIARQTYLELGMIETPYRMYEQEFQRGPS